MVKPNKKKMMQALVGRRSSLRTADGETPEDMTSALGSSLHARWGFALQMKRSTEGLPSLWSCGPLLRCCPLDSR